MSKQVQRRDFLKLAGVAGIAATKATGNEKPVRIGFVGVGNRGTGLVRILLDLPGVEIPAICDINEQIYKRPGIWSRRAGANGPKDIRPASKITSA